MLDELSAMIVNRTDFKNDYSQLQEFSMRRSLKLLAAAGPEINQLRRLYEAAAIFSGTNNVEHRLKAYRIVVDAFGSGQDQAISSNSDLLYVILSRLGNFPAIRFMLGDVKEPSYIPWPLIIETDLQARVWQFLLLGRSLALSAPTSAGKSFAYQQFIANEIRRRASYRVAYIVPTRALINQVSADLIDLVENDLKKPVRIITIPVVDSDDVSTRKIFVVTQERLQVLFQNYTDLNFDLAIVDEAHSIADEDRGVLLQSVIEELHERNPNIQFLFSSPHIANPEIFGKLFGLTHFDSIRDGESPVAQNIIFIDCDDIKQNLVTVSRWSPTDGKRQLGTIEFSQNLYDPIQKLIYLSWHFGRDSQSLVYSAGQAQCEDIATGLFDLLAESEDKSTHSDVRVQLSDFVKEAIHPRYTLVQTLKRGVGFHYGNIPSLVRQSIEKAFSDGHLKFIVSTSTLLHGVNLPARNLFLNRPSRGEDKPITAVDFWNLAGRAGRLGKEFEGNVFLIDYPQWQSQPLKGEKVQAISASVQNQVVNRHQDLLNYLMSTDIGSGIQQEIEATFGKLFFDLRHKKIDSVLDRLDPTLDPDRRAALIAKLSEIRDKINLTDNTLDKSLNVSAFRQQSLYQYFMERLKEKDPSHFIPLHPSADFNRGLDKLYWVFKRIHTYLQKLPKNNRSHFYFAPLALRWMRGDPLPLLISDAIAYYENQGRERSPATVIREVLTNVETDLRFRYVKYLTCYNAILQQALEDSGHADIVAHLPALPLYLELGASSRTMISFLQLGLSRISARKLTDKTVDRDMEKSNAVRWLRNQNIDSMDISPIILREVRMALRNIS
jgi:hypothetical protein